MTRQGQEPELRRLVVGERVRDVDTRVEYMVERVTGCSALLREVYRNPKVVRIVDKRTGEERCFEARSGGDGVHVSPCAFVEHLGVADA